MSYFCNITSLFKTYECLASLRITLKVSSNHCYFFSTFSRPNYCLSTLQIKVESLSEICCDVLNRNLCCCKGNNDYFSTLVLYTMHDGKSHGKMHPMSSVCFSQLLSAVCYDRIRFHGAQCVEIISEAKVLFMWTFSRDISYSFILTVNVSNVHTKVYLI